MCKINDFRFGRMLRHNVINNTATGPVQVLWPNTARVAVAFVNDSSVTFYYAPFEFTGTANAFSKNPNDGPDVWTVDLWGSMVQGEWWMNNNGAVRFQFVIESFATEELLALTESEFDAKFKKP